MYSSGHIRILARDITLAGIFAWMIGGLAAPSTTRGNNEPAMAENHQLSDVVGNDALIIGIGRQGRGRCSPRPAPSHLASIGSLLTATTPAAASSAEGCLLRATMAVHAAEQKAQLALPDGLPAAFAETCRLQRQSNCQSRRRIPWHRQTALVPIRAFSACGRPGRTTAASAAEVSSHAAGCGSRR